jgi:seryl-tRNA synthetase
MHDLKFLRDHPDQFDAALKRRGIEACSTHLLALDEAKRKIQTDVQQLQQERKIIAGEVGKLKAQKKETEAEAAQAKARELNDRIADLEKQLETDQLTLELGALPNRLDDDVPNGADEHANKEIRKWGTPSTRYTTQHFDLGEALGLLDFEQTAKISGARFCTLRGGLARMERALANFMLDMHTKEHGYTEIVPPFLVQSHAMYGSNQLPKFAEGAFQTTGGYWLIPTSEVPLVNSVRERIMEEEELPLRLTAYSPCFRSEAGSAGKDTRGMIRLHQFSKVELVTITTPEASRDEHERMTTVADEVLKRLELPYRVMLLCSGDTGFGAQKTYDLEVWLPGQNTYREISSCSNCGDFQARRMQTRYNKKGEKQKIFPHTLNGSALAVGRTIVAIMENYQQENGTIAVPTALQPYMGGMTTVEALS